MKNLLSIAILSSILLVSNQTIASSNSKTNNYSPSISGLEKTLTLNSAPNNLVGTWVKGNTKYIFYADGTFAYVTSMFIYVGCGTAKSYAQMGNFQIVKGGINFQPTSARLRQWNSCTGMVLSETPAAKDSVYGAYATLQNNDQTLTLTIGGKSTSYQKSR